MNAKNLTPMQAGLRQLEQAFRDVSLRKLQQSKVSKRRQDALQADYEAQEAQAREEAREVAESFRDDYEPVDVFIRGGRGWSRRVDGYNREQEL